MRKTFDFRYILITVLIFLGIVFGGFYAVGAVPVFAATTEYTGVIEDLSRDKNFDASKYPKRIIDYSLSVIQIAESDKAELFVYVYQPYGSTDRYRATSINISTTIKESLRYYNYALKYLNSEGTLYKYKVEDFKVQKLPLRYYDISSIYRRYDRKVDGEPAEGQTISEKAFHVGQFWNVCTVEDKTTYNYENVEVIEVSEQTVGTRRYSNGINAWTLEGSACDAHYLAFSCKRQIDNLISADLEFYSCTFEKTSGNTTLGDEVKHFVTLRYDEYAENEGGGWLGKKERWDRIASTEEFLNSGLEFPAEEKKLFEKFDWVLNFYESPFDVKKNTGFTAGILLSYWITGDKSYVVESSGEYTSDVTLMRLEFETDGEIYNLGVVSNKQTGPQDPTNIVAKVFTMPWWGWLIVAAIVILLLILLCLFIKPVSVVVTAILKALMWLLAAPFKLIAAGVRRYRENAPLREQRRAEKLRRKRTREAQKAENHIIKERKADRKLSKRASKMAALEKKDIEREMKQRLKDKLKSMKQAEKRKNQRKRNNRRALKAT